MMTNVKIKLEQVSCPLVCQKGDKTVLTGRDLLHDLPGEFTVVKCLDCGLMRTNPRPTSGTVGFYYPDDYWPCLGTQVKHVVQKKTTIYLKNGLGFWRGKFSNLTLQILYPLAWFLGLSGHTGRMTVWSRKVAK